MESAEMNRRAWLTAEKYLHLNTGRHRIAAPYFTNDVGRMFGRMLKTKGLTDEVIKELFEPYNRREIDFGWYRGKGSPEELETAFALMAEKDGIDTGSFSAAGAREYMLLNGLGVDCSGFAYNVMAGVVGKENLNGVLKWKTEEQEVYKAGAFTFGWGASDEIGPGDIRPLDLLLFRKPDGGRYYHIALILEKNGWQVVQSTSTAAPMGADVSQLKITRGEPDFGFRSAYGKDWNRLYREGRIEIRRLKILK